MAYLTVSKIRQDLLDRSPADNELLGDLEWSDDEIRHALRRAAMAYNELPPYVAFISHNGAAVPEAYWSYEAVAEALLRMRVQSLARNEAEHNAGGVAVNPDGTRMRNMAKLADEIGQRWRMAASDWKRTVNLQGFYGSLG